MRILSMVLLGTLVGLVGCVSMTPAAEAVRITTSPDVVANCKFLGNVKATSGFGGPLGTALGESNAEKALQKKTLKLGGNVLNLTSSGVHSSGEAYRCPDQ